MRKRSKMSRRRSRRSFRRAAGKHKINSNNTRTVKRGGWRL